MEWRIDHDVLLASKEEIKKVKCGIVRLHIAIFVVGAVSIISILLLVMRS